VTLFIRISRSNWVSSPISKLKYYQLFVFVKRPRAAMMDKQIFFTILTRTPYFCTSSTLTQMFMKKYIRQ